jgi:excisionase family DNA binding protein
LLLRIEPDCTAALGVCRAKVYELIADGELETIHLGRAVRVTAESIAAFIERQRRAEPANAARAKSEARELLERALAKHGGKPWKRGKSAAPSAPHL